jgi:hypothetical protein
MPNMFIIMGDPKQAATCEWGVAVLGLVGG